MALLLTKLYPMIRHCMALLLQDTLCLLVPYQFQLEPLEEFDPLADFDKKDSDDVWFARPQLCLRAACATQVKYKTRLPPCRFRWCSSAHLNQSPSPQTAACRELVFPCCTSEWPPRFQRFVPTQWNFFQQCPADAVLPQREPQRELSGSQHNSICFVL